MHPIIAAALGALVATALGAAPTQPAAEARVLKAAQGARLVVNGDSTLHKWQADATELSIQGGLDKPGEPLAAIQAQGLRSLELVAQVKGLKSKDKGLDRNMHKAMDADRHPEIRFSLSGYTLKGDQVEAKGTLSIHGQSREVALPGTVTAKDGGVRVRGSYGLKMTDYGIKPPAMMMGTIRTADEVTISYDFTLQP